MLLQSVVDLLFSTGGKAPADSLMYPPQAREPAGHDGQASVLWKS